MFVNDIVVVGPEVVPFARPAVLLRTRRPSVGPTRGRSPGVNLIKIFYSLSVDADAKKLECLNLASLIFKLV